MSEVVSISIKLCNRTYRIKVNAENEKIVRDRIIYIQSKINELKKSFPGRDDHDYMAMTMIDYFTSQNESAATPDISNEDLLSQLKIINQLLD